MSGIRLKHQLKVITVPVFIEIALVMLLGAVDTVMLSRYSDNSVAAVGLDNQLISLVFLVYQFFSMGAAILCAQYIGASSSFTVGVQANGAQKVSSPGDHR
jgi:Na+-driven multidrug efflux pump